MFCAAKIMQPSNGKTRVITFTRKRDPLKLCDFSMIWTDNIKDLTARIDSKLYFYRHVDYTISHSIKLRTKLHSLYDIFSFYS
jgi:hypothetical protein